MSKIVITISDNDDGTVQCVSVPSALGIAHKINQPGEKITPGEAYALLALRTIANKSREERKVVDAQGRPFEDIDFGKRGNGHGRK